MEGNIFDVQRFCVHDGPGIRTTVFFKGCPLRCIWCHNPESQSVEPCLSYYPTKCMSCGGCAAVCPNSCHLVDGERHLFRRDRCVGCGECVKACPTDALAISGRRASVEELIAEAERDRTFYKTSGGGLTVSGGEPLAQPEFLTALLRAAKERGIHTCVETCGFASEQTVRAVAEHTDIFLYDIKETDGERHRKLTGVPLEPIMRNLALLDSLGSEVVLRCPLIPDINTREEHLCAIAEIAVAYSCVKAVNVMAYHSLGNSKYDAIGLENRLPKTADMSGEQKAALVKSISDKITALGGCVSVSA